MPAPPEKQSVVNTEQSELRTEKSLLPSASDEKGQTYQLITLSLQGHQGILQGSPRVLMSHVALEVCRGKLWEFEIPE